MSGDVFDHLAAIELPLPDGDGGEPEELLDELREETLRQRYFQAEELREVWTEAWSRGDRDGDPVLVAIDEARRAMLKAEQHTRLLLAYGYEFVRPRGYTLAQLAAHAGMSISGVRTAYDLEEEGRIVAERTGLQPRRRHLDMGDEATSEKSGAGE